MSDSYQETSHSAPEPNYDQTGNIVSVFDDVEDSFTDTTSVRTSLGEVGYDAELSSYTPSVQWPRRPASVTSSRAPSVYSYHSSIDGHLFRDDQGRSFNTMNQAYRLPADLAEHDRLDLQHIMLSNYIGGLYMAKDIVDDLLEPGQDHTPTVLDVGAGSGAWIMDMATKFPECEFIGIDLVPPSLGVREPPDNCRFEIDDANLSMTHWANMFDIVHLRATHVGIHDFEDFMYQVAQTIKPGGLLMLGGGSADISDEQGNPRPDVDEGQEGFAWLKRYFSAIYMAYSKSGTRIDASSKWHTWAENNPNYEQVVKVEMLFPVGNWKPATSPEQHYANEINRINVINLCKSYAPMLVNEGYPEDIIKRWTKETEKELTALRVCSNCHWTWTWCRRTEGAWIPRPDPDDN